jgi:hypothetical protein
MMMMIQGVAETKMPGSIFMLRAHIETIKKPARPSSAGAPFPTVLIGNQKYQKVKLGLVLTYARKLLK